MPAKIFDLYRDLKEDGIIFCFCGSVSQSVVEGIGTTLWIVMEREGTDVALSSRVFPILVEQMQNIVHHSAERIPVEDAAEEEEVRFGIVIVGKKAGRFYVRCGNYVGGGDVQSLDERLRHLGKLNKDELKSLYLQERKKAKEGLTSQRAGLGLIEIARKASEPLEYSIEPAGEGRFFFSMTTIV